jgi:hypothetical protein
VAELPPFTRPFLYPKQEEAIFCEERYGVCEASTKSGKTVGCIVWIVEQAWGCKEGQNVWWVAPVFPQAEVAFRRMKQFLPDWSFTHNDSKMFITLANGAMIWFKSAEKSDNLYGEDVYAVVIDEATRVRETSWWAIRSTITATRAPVRIIGNVKGRKNWAYRMARRAESGDSDHHFAKITAWDAVEAGILDADEVEGAKRHLPDHIYRELYLAEPGDDEGNPFGIEAIRACICDDLSTDKPIGWGWDLAKSYDWTVGIGLDNDGVVCRLNRFQSDWEFTFQTILAKTKKVGAIVDSTGVGDPIVERLRRDGGRNFHGFKFTAGSKQQLMERLAVAIQNQEVWFPEGVIATELENFEYEYTRGSVRYSAPDGLHDDCVVALALAVMAQTEGRKRFSGNIVIENVKRVSYWKRN